MTAARIRGCQRIRSTADTGVERLKGFKAVIEDWHAKVVFLEVSCTTFKSNK